MADPSRSTDSGFEPDRESGARVPGWLRPVVIGLVIVALLVVAMMLIGGGHAPPPGAH